MTLEASTPVGCWVWLVDVDTVYADRGLASYFGLHPREAAGGLPIRVFLNAVHQNDLPGLDTAIRKTITKGGTFTHSYRVKTASKEWRRVVGSGACFHPLDGSPQIFAGWVSDIRRVLGGQRSALERAHHMITEVKDRSTEPVVSYVLEDVLLSLEELFRGN